MVRKLVDYLFVQADKPYTAKNIRRFYGKITGNQLPVHFQLFLQAPEMHSMVFYLFIYTLFIEGSTIS